jgi:hypothetical protein
MKHLRKIIISGIIILSISFSGCSGSSSDDSASAGEASASAGVFQAGAAIKALVPADNPEWYKEVCLGGFGILGVRNFGKLLTARAKGVHDSPYARAMVLEQDGSTIAFLVIDAAMISNNVIEEIADGVAMRTGIPSRNVLVAVTHSHSSLDLLGYMGGVSPQYRKFLINASIQVVVNAFEDMTPARLMISQTQYQPSVIIKENGENAQKNGEDLKWIYNRRGWTTLSDEEADAERAKGFKPNFTHPDVDFTINVLEAVDIETGQSKGVMINYACHPVIVTDDSSDISRDFCGYLVDYVQKQIHAPAIFIQGTQGDVNPGDWEDFDANKNNCYGFAKQLGEDVAKQALQAMNEEQVPISSGIHFERSTVNVSIDNPLFITLLYVQRSLIDMTFTGENRAKALATYIRLGNELQIAAYPGETLTHIGLGIKEGEHVGKDGSPVKAIEGTKQVMKAPFKMVTALTGDALLYLVPSAEWEKSPDPMPGVFGTPYEEQMSMALNGVFADDLRKAVNRMIKADTGIK